MYFYFICDDRTCDEKSLQIFWNNLQLFNIASVIDCTQLFILYAVRYAFLYKSAKYSIIFMLKQY